MYLAQAHPGFRRLMPWQARGVLAGTALLTALFVAVTLSPLKSGNANNPPSETPSDVDLYRAEIERIRGGEGYYQAAAAELRSRGYPTASVFNWRTPLPMWLIAKLPDGAGKVLLCVLAVLLMAWSLRVMAREGGLAQAVLCAVLLFGATMPVFLADLYVMPVLWAGVLLGISACAYAQGRWPLGVAAGLVALFCRDLAGPYCLLAALWAICKGRKKEASAWLTGLLAYGVFFAVHWTTVQSFLVGGERAHDHSWVRFGGLPFVLSTVQTNAYLLVSPQWLTAIYLAAAILGFAGWNSPAGQRIAAAVCVYTLLFAVVGQPFNQYWGSLVAPLFCFGVARCPAAIADLWHASAWRSPSRPESFVHASG